MDDLLSEFLTETGESLEVIDTELVRFESHPNERETLNNIFRLVHTIKGTCGFIGLPRLEAVAHAGETLLGRFRDGALKVTPEAVTLVLDALDRIKALLAHLAAEQVEPEGDDRALIARLDAASEGGLPDKPEIGTTALPEILPVEDFSADPEVEAQVDGGQGKWDADQGRFLRYGEVSLADLEAAFATAPGPVSSEDAPPAKTTDVDDADGRKSAVGAATIRVSVDVLESMMTMVSELVLTRNQLMQMLRMVDESEFKTPLQRLSGITGELQDCVMKTRMQPIGSAWKKLPRIVRDACRDLGKKIELEMDGEATELDRQVLELIKDPLTHMIRNSCDHGVETPAERIAAGKSETGTIRLKAYHEGGHIIIEVGDDGAGLKTERIRQKAIEKGVVEPSEAMAMSETQIHRLIFAPGFSTAAKVTSISGRGVGMDVVKTNVELIGGTIDLRSRPNGGSTFSIKIPLTLAIISALIVGVGKQRFAIPQLAVLELVRAGANCEHRIEFIKNTRVLRLRDRLLPLLSLNDVLDLKHADVSVANERAYVVVMQVGETRFGLIVDQVFDTEEIVVKPLSKRLGAVIQYSGATILGDGAVIMILDPNGISKGVAQVEAATKRVREGGEHAEMGKENETVSMLLFTAGGAEPRACPLPLVTRLEDLDVTTFEMTRHGPVVQYRGRLMPLVHAAGNHAFKREGKQSVLVFNQGERVIGLAVDIILDIVEDALNIELANSAPGVLGTAVLKGRSSEVIDIGWFLSQADADWAATAAVGDRKPRRRRVLLIDAHPFFRSMLAPAIKAAGYDVTLATDLEDAQEKLGAGASFDIVLADADEPDRIPQLQSVLAEGASIIPLSSRMESRNTPVGPSVAKSDRNALLAALDEVMRSLGEAA